MAALAASSEFREIGALLAACSDRPCAHLACGFHVGFGVGFLCWCWRWNFSMSGLQFLRSDAVLSFRSKFRRPTSDSLPCQHVSSRKVLRVSEKFEFCGIRFGWGCQTSHLTVLEAKRAKRLRCNSANARVNHKWSGVKACLTSILYHVSSDSGCSLHTWVAVIIAM